MGSPSIFAGKFTKLLTQKGIINSNGSLNQFDGQKNYITYNNFENGLTTGWSLFNTTLTGGYPTGTITSGAASITTFTTTTTNPINGSYSLQAASSGVWSAGQGFISDAFTIDREDLAQPLTFQASYEVSANATNANWSGQLGSQTFAVYIYDVTNSAWVQPSGFLGMNQVTGVGIVTGSFQSNITPGQQYRLAVIALQATTGAITINFDTFILSNVNPSVGFPVTDYIDYTPTCSWSSGYTMTGKYRRVGDTLECVVKLTSGNAPLSTPDTIFGIPPGYAIDTSKLLNPAQGAAPTYGDAIGYDISVTNLYLFRVQYWTTTTVKLFYQSASTGQESAVTTSVPPTWAANDTIIAIFKVPVVGLSSSVEMSNTTATRIVAARYNLSADQSIPNNSPTTIIWNNKNFDSHGAMNTSTGVYTIPVSGYYNFKIGQRWASNATGIRYASTLITGTSSGLGNTYNVFNTNTDFVTNSATDTLYFNAGDTIAIQAVQSSGVALAFKASSAYFEIERLSGPSVIAANETVACYYDTGGTQVNIPNNAITTCTVFTNKIFDTHNSFTSGGTFTAPISGTYSVSGGFQFGVNATGLRAFYAVGPSTTSILGYIQGSSTVANMCTGSALIKLNAGQTILIKAFQNSGGNLANSTDPAGNYVSIVRVGN